MTLKLEEKTLTVPEDLAEDTRLRLAVALFDAGMISNGEGAQMAGLTRAAFLDALYRFGVTPFQYDSVEEVLADAEIAAL